VLGDLVPAQHEAVAELGRDHIGGIAGHRVMDEHHPRHAEPLRLAPHL
jgi:hypothetical protein